MRAMKSQTLLGHSLRAASIVLAGLLAGTAHAAAPGLDGTTSTTVSFNLSAAAASITQPDGAALYAWGYGCQGAWTGGYLPKAITTANCQSMQLPGPTLIVRQGATVTVTLTNNLPPAAGNTSILFPGFNVSAAPAGTQPNTCTATSPAATGLLTTEAVHGCSVSYTFVANTEGTHSYYSGTQGDLQIEMGMYGAIIVLPATVPTNCTTGLAASNLVAESTSGEKDFRLASAAYSHSATCYDREYLFQFSEMDQRIHRQVEDQVLADKNLCIKAAGCLAVSVEPYHPSYFMINGRSMPDDMDPNYAVQLPHQPYNGNPHMHPGELTLLRIIGQGRWQHPFHEHGNHVRVLARDGNLITAPNAVGTETEKRLAGPLLFTTTTTPGQAMDGIFQWTGKGLNWDVYAHGEVGDTSVCVPDANGYYTSAPAAPNYYEWCADHAKPLEKAPFGNVAGGGPMTLPDPNIVINGPWYSGSAYLGPDAAGRAVGASPIPPSGTVANSSTGEAGFAYMWHSHNEREITTDNIFPGGMLMMMLVDPRVFVIDESN
jgi:FtsP/CotA-like multicopper oxidase with cupredoxin domain